MPERRTSHARRRGSFAVVLLAMIVIAALLAPWLAPYDPQQILDPIRMRSRPPSFAHLLGTDPYARDLFSRMLFGARTSLTIAASAVLLATMLGTTIGLTAGYIGGLLDRISMRLVDVALSVPRVLLVLTVVGVWGAPTLPVLTLLLAATGWMGIARLVRGEVRAMRQLPRVEAAVALGVTGPGILLHHVLPALRPIIAIAATGALGQLLLLETGLSFLGVGVAAPAASWGTVLLDVSDVVGATRWLAVGPGLALVITVVALHRVGDALGSAKSAARSFSANARHSL